MIKLDPVPNCKQQQEKIEVEPVGGYHGITAVFPTLQMIIDYEEGRIQLNRGYPRFVQHPKVQSLEETVRGLYHADSVLAFTSFESALFIVIDAFFSEKTQTISVGGGLPSSILEFLTGTVPESPKVVPSDDAEVKVASLRGFNYEKKSSRGQARVVIGYYDEGLPPKGCRDLFDIVLAKHPQGTAGFLIMFGGGRDVFNLLRRHSGFNLSSREAERLVDHTDGAAIDLHSALRQRIAVLEGVTHENCLLFPSGMAAVFSSIMSCLDKTRTGLVLVGSAYVDTICILEKWPARRGTRPAIFVEDVNDLQAIQDAVDRDTAAVILEVPTNPLIRVADLERIVEISHQAGAKVLVDSTVATPFNLKPLEYDADIVVHSTTKFLSGMNNHLGGAALSKDKNILKKLVSFQELTKSYMDNAEAKVLYNNLHNFESRMERINRNASAVARFLSECTNVGKVYYPGLRYHPDHDIAKQYMPNGYSGLISFLLKNSNKANATAFYDSLADPIVKGPSLGAEQTLLCPYTLLAHYHDPPEKIQQMGLDRYLFRISVGTEDPAHIIDALAKALDILE